MPIKSWCNLCNSEMLRMYIRKQDVLGRREFVAIGWYCDKCKLFDSELDQNILIESCYMNQHRIYIRSRKQGRKFIPFAYYYNRVKLFLLESMKQQDLTRILKAKYNTKDAGEAWIKHLEDLERRPSHKLIIWAKKVFAQGRKDGIDDDTIVQAVKAQMIDKKASEEQINAVIAYCTSK